MHHKVFIIAGEASGDTHGASLAKALQEREPRIEIAGIGGHRMRQARVKLVYDSSRWGAFGLVASLKLVPRLYVALKKVLRHILKEQYDCLVLIDFGAFNVRLAKQLQDSGIPILYYFPPAPWSKDLDKARNVTKYVDKVCATFPLSYKNYKEVGADVTFVGHPFMETVREVPSRQHAREILGIDMESVVVGLLPGSRQQEINLLLPVMLEGVELLAFRLQDPAAQHRTRCFPGQGVTPVFVLPIAFPHLTGLVERMVAKSGVYVKLVDGNAYSVIRACDAVVVGAGTATLEAAVLGVPLLCLGKLTAIDRWFVTKTEKGNIPEFIALPNDILSSSVVPELLQDDVNAEAIAGEVYSLLTDRDRRESMLEAFGGLRKRLGDPPVAGKVAQAVFDLIRSQY